MDDDHGGGDDNDCQGEEEAEDEEEDVVADVILPPPVRSTASDDYDGEKMTMWMVMTTMMMGMPDLMPLASGRYRPQPRRGGRASPMLQLVEKRERNE